MYIKLKLILVLIFILFFTNFSFEKLLKIKEKFILNFFSGKYLHENINVLKLHGCLNYK